MDVILAQEARQFPWERILTVLIVWVVVIVFALMRGGHGAASIIGIASCSTVYWILLVLAFILALIVTVVVGLKLRNARVEKEAIGYVFHQGDVHWTFGNTMLHPAMCFLAGIAAGLLGIGGGLVLGPLFLEMGMLPEVSSATSSFMVLFTASTTSLQFLILGQLQLDYAGWLLPSCFIGALLGVLLVKRLIKRCVRRCRAASQGGRGVSVCVCVCVCVCACLCVCCSSNTACM